MTVKQGMGVLAMTLFAVALVAQPAAAQFDKAKDVAKHLEKKHDYKVEKTDDGLQAKHVDWLNIKITEYKGGLLFWAYLETSQHDRGDLLELANVLSLNATASRAYVDDEDDLIFEAWFPGKYDDDRFETLLEAWHNDTIGQGSRIQKALGL
ncbi:hypothetical protein ACFL6X_04065 [Candidatus Latescibacterota bacterium]